jgi:hypothetical protein
VGQSGHLGAPPGSPISPIACRSGYDGLDGHQVALLRAFLIRTYANEDRLSAGMLMRSAAASISLATCW